MKRSALIRCGEALYGKGLGWRTKLAKALDVQPKTITRWTSGETRIPKTAELAVYYLMLDRIVGGPRSFNEYTGKSRRDAVEQAKRKTRGEGQ